MEISIISPVYQAENLVEELVKQIDSELQKLTDSYEIILVNDGSKDQSWKVIRKTLSQFPKLIGVNLSRNFGQHNAIFAGLSITQGKWIVIMDCDLQDLPQEIKKLYAKAQEGFEIVYAKRKNRKDSFLKKLSSKYFFKLLSYLTNTTIDSSIGNFGIYSKKAISEVLKMKEVNKTFSLIIKLVGFKSSTVEVEHGNRFEGKSNYNFRKLSNLAIDLVISHSDKPLRLTVKLGFIISSLSFMFAFYNVFAYFTGIIQVQGFSSLIFSIWFLSGLVIFTLGIVGLYISKILENVKQRPPFIIDEIINKNSTSI